MTDRELLEMVAKASGICLHRNERESFGNGGRDVICVDCGKDTYGFHWNPLSDDGDAFRLADSLAIQWERSVSVADGGTSYVRASKRYFAIGVSSVVDPEHPREALRRAIVMLAAEIGKAMQ